MAQHDVLILNQVVDQIQEIQAGDTYKLPADVEITGDLAISGTVDGRDVAADGVNLDLAVLPGDDVSDLVNDANYQTNAALADQAEAQAGTDNVKTMTSLRVAEAIIAQTVQNKFDSVIAPVVTDDSDSGYGVGSVWINTVLDVAHVCVDPSVNTAIWLQTSLTVAQINQLTALTAVTSGITAFAGGGQGSAVQLTTRYNIVETVGTAGDSVKLPVASGGMVIIVKNTDAANSLDVFPSSGGTIDKLSVDTAEALVNNTTQYFFATSPTQWETLT